MRVLLTESDPHAADEAVTVLERAGHQVVRCGEPGATTFPCTGVVDAGCPLDEDVDVAVTVRELAHPSPQVSESGAICARSRKIPLVVAGELDQDPFVTARTEAVPVEELPAAVERAVRAELPRYRAAIMVELHRHLAAGEVDVEVRRSGRRIKVIITLDPSVDRSTADALAVRAAGVVRELDRWTNVVDVAVVRS